MKHSKCFHFWDRDQKLHKLLLIYILVQILVTPPKVILIELLVEEYGGD